MADHVETMSSQTIPFSNKTTITDDETASAMMVNTICVIHMIILMIGCFLVTKTALTMHGCHAGVVCFLLMPTC
jgi:hypothetical protein